MAKITFSKEIMGNLTAFNPKWVMIQLLEYMILFRDGCGHSCLTSEMTVFKNHILRVIETDGILHLSDGDIPELNVAQWLRFGALED